MSIRRYYLRFCSSSPSPRHITSRHVTALLFVILITGIVFYAFDHSDSPEGQRKDCHNFMDYWTYRFRFPLRTTTKRPDSCDGCNPHDYFFVINNENVCLNDGVMEINAESANASTHEKPFLIMLIASRPSSYLARSAIRDTWASVTSDNEGHVRAVFLFGRSLDPFLNEMVRSESAKFGDIIEEDFVDSYDNLTLKTMMGLKWASRYCGNAEFVFKVDDDVFVNPTNLLKYLRRQRRSSSSLSRLVGGRCLNYCLPYREPESPWFVSYDDYPHLHFPRFCFGPNYLLSMNVARRIFEASKDVPFFRLEDVYATGLVANQYLGFEPVSIPGMFNYKVPLESCLDYATLIASHGFDAREIRDMWKKARHLAAKCGSATDTTIINMPPLKRD